MVYTAGKAFRILGTAGVAHHLSIQGVAMKTKLISIVWTCAMVITGSAWAAFDPLSVDGLVLWLKGDAGVLNASGSPAAAGETVATWQD